MKTTHQYKNVKNNKSYLWSYNLKELDIKKDKSLIIIQK